MWRVPPPPAMQSFEGEGGASKREGLHPENVRQREISVNKVSPGDIVAGTSGRCWDLRSLPMATCEARCLSVCSQAQVLPNNMICLSGIASPFVLLPISLSQSVYAANARHAEQGIRYSLEAESTVEDRLLLAGLRSLSHRGRTTGGGRGSASARKGGDSISTLSRGIRLAGCVLRLPNVLFKETCTIRSPNISSECRTEKYYP